MPVRGINRVTPPTITKVWTPMISDSPVASSFSKGRSQRIAIRSPVPTMSRYPNSRADAPTRPSSSAMTAKIRSVDASGMWLALLCPGPSPNSPPAAMANQPWMIW